MTHTSEEQIEKLFVEILIERGYPSASIRMEKAEEGIRFDIGVYSEFGSLIQVFEFKSSKGNIFANTWKGISQQCKAKGLNPEIYIVPTGDEGKRLVEFIDGKEAAYGAGSTDYDSVLSFNHALGRYRKRISQKNEDVAKCPMDIKIASWITAFVIGVFILAPLFCSQIFPAISYELLAFLLSIYVLVILPQAVPYFKDVKRFRLGAIEVEMISKEMKKQKNPFQTDYTVRQHR